jgi:hypothetical protein
MPGCQVMGACTKLGSTHKLLICFEKALPYLYTMDLILKRLCAGKHYALQMA